MKMARCANCQMSTRYCAKHGCKTKESLFFGTANAGGYTVAVISRDRASAEKLTFLQWRSTVILGFMPEIKSYAQLKENFGECSVLKLQIDKPVILQQVE